MLTIPKTIKNFSSVFISFSFAAIMYLIYKTAQINAKNDYKQTHNNIYILIILGLMIFYFNVR
jgi:hypothetical protein